VFPYQEKKKSTQGWMVPHSARYAISKEERCSCFGRMTGSRSRIAAADAVVQGTALHCTAEGENSVLLAVKWQLEKGEITDPVTKTNDRTCFFLILNIRRKEDLKKKQSLDHVLKPVGVGPHQINLRLKSLSHLMLILGPKSLVRMCLSTGR
jgi:hypothetical protein